MREGIKSGHEKLQESRMLCEGSERVGLFGLESLGLAVNCGLYESERVRCVIQQQSELGHWSLVRSHR